MKKGNQVLSVCCTDKRIIKEFLEFTTYHYGKPSFQAFPGGARLFIELPKNIKRKLIKEALEIAQPNIVLLAGHTDCKKYEKLGYTLETEKDVQIDDIQKIAGIFKKIDPGIEIIIVWIYINIENNKVSVSIERRL